LKDHPNDLFDWLPLKFTSFKVLAGGTSDSEGKFWNQVSEIEINTMGWR
jgi:hypothetical protein